MILSDIKQKDKVFVMRVKRSKSEERRKKMIYRWKRTNEKIAEDLQKDKERKRALSKKGGKEEIKKYFKEWEENRRRMEKIRSNLSQEEKEMLRERVAELRLKQSPGEREYNNIRKKTKSKRDKKRWECRRAGSKNRNEIIEGRRTHKIIL